MTILAAAPSQPRGPAAPPRPSALLKRPASFPARAALVTANLAAVTFFLLSYSGHGVGLGPYHIDLDVYRIGGRAWLRGVDLYGRLPVTQGGAHLPFTYPPVAAVLLSPFSLVPMAAAATALTLGTVALLAVVIRVFLRRLAGAATSAWTLGWLLPLALFLEPVRDTLGFGQINVVLMALVSLDCLDRTPRWSRGALIGLAAALKLTPAAFVLFFLVRRDWRAAGTTAVSFAAVTGLGFVIAWHDSVQYWTGTVLQLSRAGHPMYASNQSILAVLARFGLDPHTPAGLASWLTLSAGIVAVAWRGMRRAIAASEDCLALSLNAFAALLISPISWSHHWVWCVPALMTLTVLGVSKRSWPLLTTVCTGLVLFAVAPQFWFPHGRNVELSLAAWPKAISSSYVFFAVLILLLACCAPTGRRAAARHQAAARNRVITRTANSSAATGTRSLTP